VALAVLFLGLSSGAAMAAAGGLYLVDGNPSCADLYEATVVSGPGTSLSDLGPLFGFKYDANPTGDVSSTLTNNPPWVLTGTSPDDPNNSVSIFNVLLNGDDEGYQFDWSATLGMDAVIVKAQGANAYVYTPEAFGGTGLIAPGGSGVSHVEFCYDYELEVDKDAAGSFDRTITWELEKSVTPEEHSGFIGDSFNSTWTVVATKSVVEDNYSISGSIYIGNPAPIPVDFSVEDLIDDSIIATVTCPADQVPANGSIECTYLADETDGIDGTQTSNEAFVTSLTEGVVGGDATAAIAFTANVTGDESVTVDDDRDTEGQFPATASDTTTYDYTETFTCSTNQGDYTSGVDSDNYPNTATATGGSTDLSADADVDVTCYIWDVSKTSDGSYNNYYAWDITKSVNPASQSGSAGDTLSWTWSITWYSYFVREDDHSVSGVITVNNPGPAELTVDVTDELTGGFAATVTCNDGDGGTSLTIPATGSGTCDYSAAPGSQLAQNTATATRNGVSVSDTVNVNWVQGTDVGLDATISDSNNVDIPADSDQPYTYTGSEICSSNGGDYTDGSYSGDATNTATITWTGGSDSSKADTSYTCTLQPLVPTKDAAGTYDRTVTWDLDKYVNAVDTELAEYTGVAGDQFNPDWLLYVDKTEVSDNYVVTGNISIYNPAGIPQTFSVNDVLNDGTVASVTCLSYEVPARGTVYCTYTASSTYTGLPAGAPNTNTATVSAPGNADQTAVATPINYTETLNGIDSGTLTDDRFSAFSETVNADANFTLPETFECSTDRADYDETGTYSITATNTATLNDEINLSDTADVTVDCEASFVDIYKTTNGQPADPTKDIAFALYSYDEFDEPVEEEIVSTLNNGANLEFQTALVPDDSYTICEYPVPAGYTFEITVNGGNVLTYAGPPGEDNPTGEIQCFDFTAPYPDEQVTLTFEVDNSYPGGAPRTPGYWKNWNTCSGGNQAETAEKLGGVGEGVFLLDDLLSQTIGDLIISICGNGILILDSRDICDVDRKDDPVNRSNDAAYTLAKALLAARLNQDAGACPGDGVKFDLSDYGLGNELTFEQVLSAADDVLSDELVLFDGCGSYLAPGDLKGKNNPLKDLANLALALYEIIDDYNNGEICTGDESH
jgi:hypothetical protein